MENTTKNPIEMLRGLTSIDDNLECGILSIPTEPAYTTTKQDIKQLINMILTCRPFTAILRIIEPIELTVSPKASTYIIVKTVDDIGFRIIIEKKLMSTKVLFNKLVPREAIGPNVDNFEDLNLPSRYSHILKSIIDMTTFSAIKKEDYFHSYDELIRYESKLNKGV